MLSRVFTSNSECCKSLRVFNIRILTQILNAEVFVKFNFDLNCYRFRDFMRKK